MTLKDLCEASNHEKVLINGKEVDIKEHLAVNKVLYGIDRIGEQFGFFKLNKGNLQVHICIADDKGIRNWYRFGVTDANEEQKSKNIRLNVVKEVESHE